LRIASEEAERTAAERDNWLKEQPHVEQLKRQLEKIAEEMPKYQKRDELKKKLDSLKKDMENTEAELLRWNTDEKELKEKIASMKQQIEDLKDSPQELQNVKIEEEKLNIRLKKLQDVLNIQIPEYERSCEKLEEKQRDFLSARDCYDEANHAFGEAERMMESCRAGILAEHLKEGEKCPVCGSLHHPQLAILSDEAVTEKELKELKDKKSKFEIQKNTAFSEAEQAKAAQEQNKKQTMKALEDCLEDEGPLEDMISRAKNVYENLLAEQNENSRKITSLENGCKTLEKTREELDRAQGSESEKLNAKKDSLLQKQSSDRNEIAAISARMEELQNLSFEDLKTAEQKSRSISEEADKINNAIQRAETNKTEADSCVTRINGELTSLNKTLEDVQKDETELKEQLQNLLLRKKFSTDEEMRKFVASEEEIASIEEKLNDYKQKVATNNESLKQAAADAEGKSLIDIEALEAICSSQEEKNNIRRRSVNEIENRIRNNREKYHNIETKKGEYETMSKEFDICNRLYALVKGNTGQGKITLEQYIQATGFDGIIAAANRRLLPMSDGQYELYRQESSIGKRSNNYLDLEVLDNYTGHRRPVGNLSGGESFKASLSLALGLSDTVSSNLGGIQMDALFIDEGFGTLDRKSIDNAMEILNNLSGANKLVGVISHREELMENISQQIRVKKTKEGSSFSVELGV
jgi:exonuclease SbcC